MKRLLLILLSLAAFAAQGQITAAYHGVYFVPAATSGYDADAAAFIAAVTGGGDVLSTTEQDAINQFVIDLKTAGIWTKSRALYPFVGSTATAHKWNLKDPRDLDAAYRLTWAGTITHGSTGVQFSAGYGNTHLNATALTLYSTSLSFWASTGGVVNGVEIGCPDPNMELAISYGGNLYSRTYDNSNSIVAANGGAPAGLYTQSVTSSSATSVYHNGTVFASSAAVSSSLPNYEIAIGRDGATGSTSLYTTRLCAGAAIGDGLNATEAAALYTALSTLNTTLSR